MTRRPSLLGILAAGLVLLLTQYLAYQQYSIAREREKRRLNRELTIAEGRFRGMLANGITAASTLAVLYKQNGLSGNFDSIAHDILLLNPYAEALQITEDGIIKKVYPPSLRPTLGIDTHLDSMRVKEEARASEKKDIYFAGPRKLRIGGEGILGKVPVVIDGKPKAVSVVLITLPTIKKALEKGDSGKSLFAYELRKKYPPQDREQCFLTSEQSSGNGDNVSVDIPEGDWELVVSHSRNYVAGDFPLLLAIMGAVLSLLTGYVVHRRAREPIRLKKIIDEKSLELMQSENRFRSAFQFAASGMTITSLTGHFQMANEEFCKMMGYTADELAQLTFRQLTHPDDVGNDIVSFNKLLSGELTHYRVEKRYIHKNGSTVWTNLSVSAVRDANSAPLYFIAHMVDITEKKVIYSELARSEANMRSMFNSTHVSYLFLSKDFTIVAFNQRMSDVYLEVAGVELKAGENLTSLLMPEKKEAALGVYESVIGTGKPIEYETAYETSAGKKYFLANVDTVRDGDKVTGICISSIEITSRKKAEFEVLRLNRLYKYISHVNTSMLRAESQNEIFSEACRIAVETGKFQMAWFGLYDEKNDRITPVAWAGYEHGYLDATGVRNVNVSTSQIPACRSIRDGRLFCYNDIANTTDIPDHIRKVMVDRNYLSAVSFPISVGSKIVAAFVLMMSEPFFFNDDEVKLLSDVTDNITYSLDKLRVRELRDKAEANLSSVFENTDVGHLLLDKDSHVVAFNQKYINGYDQAMIGNRLVPGVNYVELLSQSRRDVVEQYYQRVLSTQKSQEYEAEFNLGNGLGYFSIIVAPVLNNGEVDGLCISVFDVTRRKLLELEREKVISELTRRNKDLEQFSFIVSHNIRGPLATILGMGEILTKENMSASDSAIALRGIKDSSMRLDNVISDLNTVLRARREISEAKVAVSLPALLQDVLGSMNQLVTSSGARISSDFTAIETIHTVRSYLYSIFLNLITNSIRYTKKDTPPVIGIVSNNAAGQLLLSFSDNGIGIDLEKQKEKIFRLYQRFNTEVEGKGMGLFMCKTQVEILGGKIEVESQPGVGTTFYVTLPIEG